MVGGLREGRVVSRFLHVGSFAGILALFGSRCPGFMNRDVALVYLWLGLRLGWSGVGIVDNGVLADETC